MTESHSPDALQPAEAMDVPERAMPPSLPDPDVFSAPREHDLISAIDRRLAAVEDLATAIAEALASDDRPQIGSALRNLRKVSRG